LRTIQAFSLNQISSVPQLNCPPITEPVMTNWPLLKLGAIGVAQAVPLIAGGGPVIPNTRLAISPLDCGVISASAGVAGVIAV
jgi:hypothetical protein